MPVQKCSKDGKPGYRWGDNGACYTTRDAKKRALKQGVAIELNKQKRGKPSEFDKAALAYIKELVTKKEWAEAARFCLENAQVRDLVNV